MQLKPKKSLGQHFLTSDIVPGWMIDAGNVQTGEKVLEIGPGTGVLTSALLKTGATVVAVETDSRALAILRETFREEIASGQLQLHQVDVRALDVTSLGLNDHQFKVVANIPYYLSGHLFRSLLENPIQPNTLVFLVQKEVAKRAEAQLPPALGAKGSLLALATQVYGQVRCTRTVSRGHFNPPPQVDSAIVAITNINRDDFSDISEAAFFNLIRTGFSHKRKQLFGILKQQYEPQVIETIFATCQLPTTIRAEDLSLQAWKQLTKAIHETAASAR